MNLHSYTRVICNLFLQKFTVLINILILSEATNNTVILQTMKAILSTENFQYNVLLSLLFIFKLTKTLEILK